jgi:Protein of unknown function (DUF3225)
VRAQVAKQRRVELAEQLGQRIGITGRGQRDQLGIGRRRAGVRLVVRIARRRGEEPARRGLAVTTGPIGRRRWLCNGGEQSCPSGSRMPRRHPATTGMVRATGDPSWRPRVPPRPVPSPTVTDRDDSIDVDSTHDGDRPDDERDVGALFDQYERDLVANDVAAMDAVFWRDPRTVRFGVREVQVGFDAIAAWRATATPVSPRRRITSRHVLQLAPGVVAVDITFVDGDAPTIGRQSQTWVRVAEGWRIARAHVSVIDAP